MLRDLEVMAILVKTASEQVVNDFESAGEWRWMQSNPKFFAYPSNHILLWPQVAV